MPKKTKKKAVRPATKKAAKKSKEKPLTRRTYDEAKWMLKTLMSMERALPAIPRLERRLESLNRALDQRELILQAWGPDSESQRTQALAEARARFSTKAKAEHERDVMAAVAVRQQARNVYRAFVTRRAKIEKELRDAGCSDECVNATVSAAQSRLLSDDSAQAEFLTTVRKAALPEYEADELEECATKEQVEKSRNALLQDVANLNVLLRNTRELRPILAKRIGVLKRTLTTVAGKLGIVEEAESTALTDGGVSDDDGDDDPTGE